MDELVRMQADIEWRTNRDGKIAMVRALESGRALPHSKTYRAIADSSGALRFGVRRGSAAFRWTGENGGYL